MTINLNWTLKICSSTDNVRNAVARRGPNQMGMGPQLPQQGLHGMPMQQHQVGMTGQSHMMVGQQDHTQYDPNQMQQQQQPGQLPNQQPGQAQPGHQVSVCAAPNCQSLSQIRVADRLTLTLTVHNSFDLFV